MFAEGAIFFRAESALNADAIPNSGRHLQDRNVPIKNGKERKQYV